MFFIQQELFVVSSTPKHALDVNPAWYAYKEGNTVPLVYKMYV